MTSIMACQFCTHWRQRREKNANWGTCVKIRDLDEVQNETRAYFSNNYPIETEVSFHTLNSFYCQLFERRKVEHIPNVVDKARGLAKVLHERKAS